jgi:hypothetical protein
MDEYFRLSCSGGDADGWLVSNENLEDEIASTLESWAQDDLGAWGYGDVGPDATYCANHTHETYPRDGCEDCSTADRDAAYQRIELWAKRQAPGVAAELFANDRDTIRRGDRSLSFRLRQA